MLFVSSSSLLDCERFDKTDSIIFNYLLRCCARAYFGIRRIHGNQTVQQSNVITHMTKDFPPCFISDGNAGTFTDQAMDMAARAKELGIPHQPKLFPGKRHR